MLSTHTQYSPPFGSCSSKPWKHSLYSPFSYLLGQNVALPPSHQEHLDIVIKQAEDTLQILHSSMEHLIRLLSEQELHLGELETFIHRHQQLANRQLIATSNFPPELLLTIFTCLLEEDDEEFGEMAFRHDSLNPVHPIWTVSQVCRRWRHIARSAPSLWSSVSVGAFGSGHYEDPMREIKVDNRCCRIGAQLALATNHVLNIRIIEQDPPPELPPYIRPVINLLLLNHARIRHLSLTVPQISSLMSSDEPLPEQTFPLLQSLEYRVTPSSLPPPPALSNVHYYLPWTFGHLKELRLFGLSSFNTEWPAWITVPWSQLEVLSVSDCETSWMPFFIPEMVSLRSLSLQLKERSQRAPFGAEEGQRYHLPSLQTLEVSYPKRPAPSTDDGSPIEPPMPSHLPPWPSWLVALDAPQLRRLTESCLWIDGSGQVGTPRLPGTGMLKYLSRVGKSITHFHCEELCCDILEEAFVTLLALLRLMPSLKSLGICLNLTGATTWRHGTSNCTQYSASPYNLFRALGPDDAAQGVLPVLEHLRITTKLYGLRGVEKLGGLVDVLEHRWEQGSLKEVELVFVKSPGTSGLFASSEVARMERLRRRGLLIRTKHIVEQHPRRFTRHSDWYVGCSGA